jgi:phosphoglycolate phosphatase-like HAD superfamily hydrolase
MTLGVLFDLDGTLVTFNFDIQGSRKALLEELSRSGFDVSQLGFTTPTQRIIDAARGQVAAGKGDFGSIKKRLFAILDGFELEGGKSVTAFPEAKKTLAELRSRSAKLGVLTNSGRKAASRILERSSLTGFFDFVLTRDDVDAMKPSPEGMNKAISMFGLPKEKVVYVGDGLLDILAAKLQTRFEAFHSDSELLAIKQRYILAGERRFATLEQEFPADVFGVTFRRLSRKPWEPEYLSVIDCRGDKVYRANYTKHEIGHLLILTDQLRISFSRTFCTQDLKDPEESLVDVIAGRFAFWPPLFKEQTIGPISFDRIEEIRVANCPEASKQSALLGIVKAWQGPCVLLEARLALRKDQQRMAAQGTFAFRGPAQAALRVSNVTVNDAAADAGLRVHRNWRVPEQSVMFRVFNSGGDGVASEDLSWWETSSGTRLPAMTVNVEARRTADALQALITLPTYGRRSPFH